MKTEADYFASVFLTKNREDTIYQLIRDGGSSPREVNERLFYLIMVVDVMVVSITDVLLKKATDRLLVEEVGIFISNEQLKKISRVWNHV